MALKKVPFRADDIALAVVSPPFKPELQYQADIKIEQKYALSYNLSDSIFGNYTNMTVTAQPGNEHEYKVALRKRLTAVDRHITLDSRYGDGLLIRNALERAGVILVSEESWELESVPNTYIVSKMDHKRIKGSALSVPVCMPWCGLYSDEYTERYAHLIKEHDDCKELDNLIILSTSGMISTPKDLSLFQLEIPDAE